MKSRFGQVTIFVIVAVILVAGVIGFFIFRDSFLGPSLPASFEPVYNTLLSCLEEDALVGINLLESRGGHISLPDFEPGSTYMPFSNQLDFLGNPIPYWYYVSGNNVQQEQVPSIGYMEEQLEDYLADQIRGCVFEQYYGDGFEIIQGEPEASVKIKGDTVEVGLDMDFSLTRAEENVFLRSHEIVVDSKLGNLYDSAKEVYDYEQKNLFLEDYGIDVLRLYAPVDGVELTCAPLTWNSEEIFDELEKSIEANTLSLKTTGGSYSLQDEKNKYFVVDVSVNNDVQFLNSKNWPHSFEIEPAESSVLISKPVGNQQGMGILGFCYVPYHFVYNINYPVLVQVSSGMEIFQFPMAVVIQGNMPRQALETQAAEVRVPEFCNYKNTVMQVNTYDTSLNPVEADISYLCSGTKCDIGKTDLFGTLIEEFPQCANGFVLASAEGFVDGRAMYSSVSGGSVDLIMDKLYEVEIDLKLNNVDYNGDAIISFISDEASKTIVYPGQKSVELSEAQYEIQVQTYKNSSLKLSAETREQCTEVPQTGLAGLFGLTKEKCFNFEIPAQIVSNALAGGGKENYYILESELSGSNSIEINAKVLPIPRTIEQLQDNYILFEENGLDVVFK